jgi:response regulator RpfG family c-di-GMP phosphodiesterase
MARNIALTHHERFDGSGYPNRLKGYDIPLCGRIIALADVYDALISRRIYKAPFTHETAKEEIVKGRGTHFDPDVVDSFLAREEQFVNICKRFSESENDVTG